MEMTNGEVRMQIYDGSGRGKYKFVFAGPARTFENGVGLNDEPRLNMEEFEFVMQATERNKIKERGTKNGKNSEKN